MSISEYLGEPGTPAKLANLFESMRVGVYRLDLTSEPESARIVDICGFVEEISGYRREDLVGSDLLLKIIHPDDLEANFRHWKEAVLQKKTSELTYRIVRKDGLVRWIRDLLRPELDDAGNVVSLEGMFVDITEYRNLPEVVDAHLGQYESLYTAAPLAFVVWDRDTRIIDWNRRAEALFGWAREEAIGRSYFDLILLDEDKPRAQEGVTRLLGGESPTHRINQNRTRDGRIILCEWNSSVVKDADGQVVAVISLGLDRSKEDHANRKAEESQTRLDFILRSQGTGAFEWDRVSDKMWWSDRLPVQFGLEAGEDPGPGFDERFPERWRRELLEALESGQSSFRLEFPITRPDGSQHWLEGRVHVIPDAEGKPGRVLGTVAGVTERKKWEQSLARSEEKFRSVFTSSPVGMVLFSFDDLRIIEINEGFARASGYRAEELEGRTVSERDAWVHPEKFEKVREEVFAGPLPRMFEVELRTKRGKVRVCDMGVTRITLDGALVGLAIFSDITDKRRAESSLRSAYAEIERLRDQLAAENTYLREELDSKQGFGSMVGVSDSLKSTLQKIDLVAPTDATVMILGESGTGKELVAREIHRRSHRSDRSLIRVNCASVPSELYESEFFGHVKGAFTGAVQDRVGRFELADGGTLFLDEVSEIPLEIQAKLLRVLQDGHYERVGSSTTRRANVRILAASNRDLRAEVEAGRFRKDLFYRLNVFPIEVAPLRERKEDIGPLAAHFLKKICGRERCTSKGLTRANLLELEAYDWPGNVRELENVMERAVIASRGNTLCFDLTEVLPRDQASFVRAEAIPDSSGFLTEREMRERERANLVAALRAANWRVFGDDGAAALLGIKPTTLASRMKRMGIEKPADKGYEPAAPEAQVGSPAP